jgi:hypothetical protein
MVLARAQKTVTGTLAVPDRRTSAGNPSDEVPVLISSVLLFASKTTGQSHPGTLVAQSYDQPTEGAFRIKQADGELNRQAPNSES